MKELYKNEEENIKIYGVNHEYLGDKTSTIGFTKDNYEIYIIADDELNVPHFHYRKRNNQDYEFLTFIKIEEPDYLNHKNSYDIMNNNQKEELLTFLKSPNNWEKIIYTWNNINDIQVDKNLKVPNYLNLK